MDGLAFVRHGWARFLVGVRLAIVSAGVIDGGIDEASFAGPDKRSSVNPLDPSNVSYRLAVDLLHRSRRPRAVHRQASESGHAGQGDRGQARGARCSEARCTPLEVTMKAQINRRQLFAFLGIAVTAACRHRSARVPGLQQPAESTVTLIVDGMV